jgi:hypothetical protein
MFPVLRVNAYIFSIGLEHPFKSTPSNGARNVHFMNAASKMLNRNQYDMQLCRYMVAQEAITVTNGGMSLISSFSDALYF